MVCPVVLHIDPDAQVFNLILVLPLGEGAVEEADVLGRKVVLGGDLVFFFGLSISSKTMKFKMFEKTSIGLDWNSVLDHLFLRSDSWVSIRTTLVSSRVSVIS